VTKGTARATVKRLVWELRTLAGRSPLLCRWLLHRSGEVATAETEICIEGFPRSGNTFAVIAFQQGQTRTVSIAHHVHAPGSVIAAARMGKPTLVLLREPEEAVVSMVIRYPHLSLGQALRGYRRFYAPLAPYLDRVVVGGFEDVIADLGALIRQINRRFGTSFREFEPTEANVSRAMEELDRWDLNTFGEGEHLELGRARPSDRREHVKRALRERYRHPRLAKSREKAERLHESFARRKGQAGNGY
jgi:hypothetical protein